MNFKKLLPKKYYKKKNKYFLSEIEEYDFKGDYLGAEINNEFIPSLKLLEINKTLPSVVVNDKNAWIFSLGRDITDVSKDEQGEILLVKTARNEIIGVCKRLNNKFKNLWDIGHLLRREKN